MKRKRIEVELDEFTEMNEKLDQAIIQNRTLKEEVNYYKEKANKLEKKLLMDKLQEYNDTSSSLYYSAFDSILNTSLLLESTIKETEIDDDNVKHYFIFI